MHSRNPFIRKSVPIVTILVMAVMPAQAREVGEVIEKVRKALGIESLESQDKAVRLTGPLQLTGLDGTQTLTFDGSGRFRHCLDAKITMDTVFDGKTVRSRNIGGEVCDEVLADRTASLMEAWAATGLWFTEDRCKSFKLDDSSDTIVLTMDLDNGRSWAKVELDSNTWLPAKWTYAGPIRSATIHLEDYMPVNSLQLPRRVRNISESGDETITQIAKATMIDAPDWSDELAAIKPPDNINFESNAKTRLEVKRAPTGHLLVHPMVNGKDVGWFAFDTGAGENCIDARAVNEAGMETFGTVPAVGVGGTTKATFCRPESLQLGVLTLKKPLAVVMDLAFLDPHLGVKIGGIIGYGTLARCVAEVDLTQAVISLHDPDSYQLRGGKWTSLILYDGVPCVPGRFEKHEGVFRLDTGASGHPVAFHAPTVKRLKLLEDRETDETSVGGVGGRKSARGGQIESLEFGGKRHKNVSAVFAIEPDGAFADSYIDANIGVELIGKSIIVLDYPHSRIAFKPKSAGRKKHGGKAVPGHTAGR